MNGRKFNLNQEKVSFESKNKGRVEHWCSPGVALERFDARAYSGPQQTGVTPAPPHQTVRMVFPYTAFRCSSSGGMRPCPASRIQTWPSETGSSVVS